MGHTKVLRMRHRLYWFLYNHFGRRWNDFKDFIGHPSDPLWIRWLVDTLLDVDTLTKELNKEIYGEDD